MSEANIKKTHMLQIQIKTFRKGMQLPEHHFFVLSNGRNSGRPATSPSVNSFVIAATSAGELDTLFWLTYAAWQGRAFHYYLNGSVIPFIRISDYRHQLTAMLRKVPPTSQPLAPIITALQLLDQKELNAKQQLKTISAMRTLIVQKFMCQ